VALTRVLENEDENHFGKDRRRGVAFGTLQQAVDHQQQGDPDRRASPAARRVGQARRTKAVTKYTSS